MANWRTQICLCLLMRRTTMRLGVKIEDTRLTNAPDHVYLSPSTTIPIPPLPHSHYCPFFPFLLSTNKTRRFTRYTAPAQYPENRYLTLSHLWDHTSQQKEGDLDGHVEWCRRNRFERLKLDGRRVFCEVLRE
jgi:hypothetical protein